MNSIERNEVFELAFRFVTETAENIFLTGKAGTGKTTFLKYLSSHSTKNIIIAAPTGVAAINAGGVTLHSLFQLPFHPFLPTRAGKSELLGRIRYNRQRQLLLSKMDLLVIDEISMVRCDVMDAIDTILRSVRRNHDEPFGGVQLLCIGDLYQLPPVAQNAEWNILSEYYASPFFFDSLAIREQQPLLIELDTIYRQKEGGFVNLLNKVRNNNMDADDFEDLHQRFIPGFSPVADENYITLTSHNNQADQINQRQLQQLYQPFFTYQAIVENEFPEQMYPAEAALVLKEGAQVMFLKNDAIRKRFYNGKIGRVKYLDNDKIIVEADGMDIEVGRETWENSRYTLNRKDGKLEQEVIGTFSQYPLRLAWAITIHKSQGLTFEKVMIDAGAAFSSGQVYVALSRCTSLDGIVLLSKIPATAISSNEQIHKGQQSLRHKGSLSERFDGARQLYTIRIFEEMFSFSEMEKAAEALVLHTREHSGKLNTDAYAWVEQIFRQILGEKSTGLRFSSQVASLMKEIALVEENAPLQQRLTDAANYFTPRLAAILSSIQNHPLITESRETAAIINDDLLALGLSVHQLHYQLQYCLQSFSLTGFLQHRLNYVLPKLTYSCYAGNKKQQAQDVPNPELYDTLKRWRDMICEEQDLPIYMVANQASLREICTWLPFNKKDLQQIAGFGKAKAEKYGDDIVEAVESYCSRHNIESNMDTMPKEAKKEKRASVKTNKTDKPDTKMVSLNLFQEGKTMDAIAAERKLSLTTIEGHIAFFVAAGKIGIDKLVTKERQELIRETMKKMETRSSKIILENLPEGFSYGEIKMVLADEERIANGAAGESAE